MTRVRACVRACVFVVVELGLKRNHGQSWRVACRGWDAGVAGIVRFSMASSSAGCMPVSSDNCLLAVIVIVMAIIIIVIFTRSGEPRNRRNVTARTMEASSAASSDGDYDVYKTTII